MTINGIILNTPNGIPKDFSNCGNTVSGLFHPTIENNQPLQDLDRLGDVVRLEDDPQVQQAARVLFAEETLRFKQALEQQIAKDATKSGLEDIAEETVRIFQKCRDAHVYDLFPLLDQFSFNQDQKRSLHAAIMGATQDSPQVERLLELGLHFSDHAERYTLQFVDGKTEMSKAELCAYGNFFTSFFSSTLHHNSNGIPLKIIPTSNGEIELGEATFDSIMSVMRGEKELDFDEFETFKCFEAIAEYFGNEDLKTEIGRNLYNALQQKDLTQYEGTLTDEEIDKILAVPSLQKAGALIDLRALFPKLSILDESVWKAHVDMAAHGLDVDTAVDQRVAIKNLHEMYRRLKIEGGAGITLLTMPAGLTLNKLLAIAKNPLQGNAIGCRYIWDQIVNQYGDAAIPKAYTLAVTNSVLDKSRNLTWQAQLELVEKEGCEMAGFLNLMALNLLTYISSEESKICLYGDIPWTYSRVAEKINSWPLAVGGFAPSGLYVDNYDYDDDFIGVAALRKF